MSRRGAGSGSSGLAGKLSESERFDFVEAPALAKPVIDVAKQLLKLGLTSADVCSLFTHAGAMLAHQQDGMPRAEYLALCEELFDADGCENDAAITSKGGSA